MRTKLDALYERYLRGVDWRQGARTLFAFYTFLYALLAYVHLAPEKAGQVAVAATVAAGVIYLIIPKSEKALADNLAQEALANQAQANQVIATLAHLNVAEAAPPTPDTQPEPEASATVPAAPDAADPPAPTP